MRASALDHEPLDLVLQSPDLTHQFTSLIRGDAGTDDSPADPTCAAQADFAWNVDVRNVFICAARQSSSITRKIEAPTFAQEREVQDNRKRRCVGCKDNDF